MSGIGLMVQPLLGWRRWLSALSSSPDAVFLDVRGLSPVDLPPNLPENLTLLLHHQDWPAWAARLPDQACRFAVTLADGADCPAQAIPCASSVGQLQRLADQGFPIPELLLLPGDVSGLCGGSSAFVLTQEALRRFPQSRLVLVCSGGPELSATLLRQGVDTILLADQLMLLVDYPLPAERQRRLARLQRGVIRSYTLQTSRGMATLQVAPLDPQDWRPKDPASLERHAKKQLQEITNHADRRLTPMSEAVLLSRSWSEEGYSCSDLLRLYQRVAAREISAAPGTEMGRAAMAAWLRTPLPVVQGPMTRVSDVAAFARAVADAGAMPVIAAAMLSAQRLRDVLRETSALCTDQPWGVGLLAFRAQEDLQPQIEQVLLARPDLIVLAGGQPAQIHQFGDLADRVIIHSPTPELFERQLAEGCRRFILEGRECGGHTGPCSSFSLWEGCLRVLAGQTKKVQEETLILFAGGIHGEQSTALIADLLNQFGLSHLGHGLLVGTLTLFSEEAVSTGAIAPVFQTVLLNTVHTVLLETAPGHQSRCALTPFADEFLRQRRKGLDEGLSNSKLSALLDGLILGRLRLASKGLQRQGDQLLTVSESEQFRQGMFMVGEVAALQNQVLPLRQLFEHLFPSEPSNHVEVKRLFTRSVPEPIAITGMAVALPGATSLTAYWSLIIRQECQIRVVPDERWPADCYYSPEDSATTVVSRWGTFIEPTVIDLAPYPLTPAQAAVTEPTQILALDLVSQALDAVGSMDFTETQRERTAVVFAASGGAGELGQAYTIQTALASDPTRFGGWLDHLPTWTNSSFPGVLSNVTAGRVSNAFDLSGSNLLVDAACASALAAVDVAVAKLRSGECDRAIVGSVDNLQGPFPYFCFSQSGALSKQGQSRPFCTDSDGIVIGEGCAVIVLERLETASRSGAGIYAVIDAIGSSSDGKGRSLTAPSHRGQMLAFDRAFAASDRHPSELRYYEAHGTGTPVGDQSEITALTRFLQSCGVGHQRCAVGSVKALIGHTKATAGLAGLIKAALALQNGTIPGQQSARQPLPELTGNGPVYVPERPVPWPGVTGDRLAAVSAFGFGGTNFTVLLSDRHRRQGHALTGEPLSCPLPADLSVIAFPLHGRDPLAALHEHRRQIDRWLKELSGVQRSLNSKILESPWLPCYTPTWPSTAYIAINRTGDDGLLQLDALEQRLRGEPIHGLLHVSHLDGSPTTPPPVVMLFPGQGSAYQGMGAVLMLSSPRVRQALQLLQSVHPEPDLLTRVLGGSRSNADRQAFWTPCVMHVVLMLHQLAAFDWLEQLGLRPDAVLGHSIGDYLALHASGALDLEGLVRLVTGRAQCLERCIQELGPHEKGGMLVVKEPLTHCEQRLASFPSLTLANRNAPVQGVVAGPDIELTALHALLEQEGVETMRLDLPVAYHHPSLKSAADEFADLLEQVVLQAPADGCSVRLSTDPWRQLTTPEGIKKGLRAHLTNPVHFVETVQHVEMSLPGSTYIDVGPRQTGSRLLQANGIEPSRILRMDDREDPVSQPLRVAFALLERGVPLDEAALMRQASEPRRISWTREAKPRLPYLVNGHGAVPLDGRSIPPSPLAPLRSSNLVVRDDPAMPNQDSDRLLEVYAEYQKTMRKFLDSQDQVFTALTGGNPTESPQAQFAQVESSATGGHGETEAPVLPPPVLVTPPSPPTIDVNKNSSKSQAVSPFESEQAMQQFITDILVDRTGYPAELLALDAHLESDLGIDSIKQVEVLGALIEALPSMPAPDQMQEIRSSARQKQTIRELSGFILTLHTGKA